MPSRDRENAGRARVGDTHTAEFKSLSHRRSMEVAVAQEAGAREANARSRGSRVAPISRTPFSSPEPSMASESLACPASSFTSSWASSHSTLPATDNQLRRARDKKVTASEAAKNTRQTRRESRTARPGRELRRVREQEIAEQPTFALRTAIRNEEPPRTPRRADADLALEARQLEADFWRVLGRTLLQLVCTYSFLFIILCITMD